MKSNPFICRLMAFAAMAVITVKSSALLAGPNVEIPFSMDGNRIVISQVRINGQGAFTFIFDTGAQGVIVSETVAAKLALRGEGYTPMGSPADPNAYQARNIDIPSFIVGAYESKNEEAIAVDFNTVFRGSKYDGIFGLSTFAGHLVTIDYQHLKLVVAKGTLDASDTNVVPVDLTRILALTAQLDGRDIPVHFDSGSPSFITLPYEWTKDLKLKQQPEPFAKGITAGREFDIYKADLIGKITIGSIVIENPEILLKTGGFPAANFGFSFLKSYLITIDMTNHRMLLQPADTQAASAKAKDGTPCDNLAGTYKNRVITCEQGVLYMQRIVTKEDQAANPGRQIQAPKFKLVADGDSEYKLEEIPAARVKFKTNEKGNMELHVLNPQGQWEKTERNP